VHVRSGPAFLAGVLLSTGDSLKLAAHGWKCSRRNSPSRSDCAGCRRGGRQGRAPRDRTWPARPPNAPRPVLRSRAWPTANSRRAEPEGPAGGMDRLDLIGLLDHHHRCARPEPTGQDRRLDCQRWSSVAVCISAGPRAVVASSDQGDPSSRPLLPASKPSASGWAAFHQCSPTWLCCCIPRETPW